MGISVKASKPKNIDIRIAAKKSERKSVELSALINPMTEWTTKEPMPQRMLKGNQIAKNASTKITAEAVSQNIVYLNYCNNQTECSE